VHLILANPPWRILLLSWTEVGLKLMGWTPD